MLQWYLAIFGLAVAGLLTWGAFSFAIAAPWPAVWTVVWVEATVLWWAIYLVDMGMLFYRPRRTAQAAVAAHKGEVVLPGSNRTVRWLFCVLAPLAALAATLLFVVPFGWAVVCAVVLALTVFFTIALMLTLPHPRRLVLTHEGVRSTWIRGDAEVSWDQIDSIRLAQGSGGLMVARIQAQPAADSFVRHWRRPLSSRHSVVDVEPLALDLDPLLVFMALETYWHYPPARKELRSGRTPERLFSDRAAADSAPRQATVWLDRYRSQ